MRVEYFFWIVMCIVLGFVVGLKGFQLIFVRNVFGSLINLIRFESIQP